MERILEGLDDFVLEMKAKGYDRMFHTNAEYTGELEESILKYFEQVLLGQEKSLKDGFSLFTYLKWEGPEQDHISAWMAIKLLAQSFTIERMSLTLGGRYGIIKSLDWDLKGKPIPTKAEAISAIDPPKQVVKKKKGI